MRKEEEKEEEEECENGIDKYTWFILWLHDEVNCEQTAIPES